MNTKFLLIPLLLSTMGFSQMLLASDLTQIKLLNSSGMTLAISCRDGEKLKGVPSSLSTGSTHRCSSEHAFTLKVYHLFTVVYKLDVTKGQNLKIKCRGAWGINFVCKTK